jgi:hypothetical protein
MWNNTFECHVNSIGVNCKDLVNKGYRSTIAAWLADEFETTYPRSYATVVDNAECIKETITSAYWYVKNIHSAPIFTGIIGIVASTFYFIY